MEYIKLKKRNDIFKLGIQDEEGNIIYDEKGNEVCLEFDLGDINLPINYNKCINKINEAKRNLKNQIIIINKRQDKKGKQMLSFNEEQKINAVREFYSKMEEAMDMFLGKGGTRKFLNGKNPYWEMWDDISESIKPFLPKMKLKVSDIEQKIKEKYGIEKKEEVLKDV